MKYIIKITYLLLLSFLVASCEKESQEVNSENLSAEEFAVKTFEIFEEVSSMEIPKEDLRYSIFKDENGFLNAKFEVIGKTKAEMAMGSFVQSKSGGTTCDGKWSCGRAIYDCLENGQDALISEGACTGVQYCVTCQDPQ